MEATDTVSTSKSFKNAEGFRSYSVPFNTVTSVNVYNTKYTHIYIHIQTYTVIENTGLIVAFSLSQ